VIAVDTNVLVYAHREEAPAHQQALSWIRKLAEGLEPWGLPVFCLGEFVRVVTHPRIFDPPTPLARVLEDVDALLESPTVRLLQPGARYLRLFTECVREGDMRGNLAFDAQIAALCREQGASLLTSDRDFARFPRLGTIDLSENGGGRVR